MKGGAGMIVTRLDGGLGNQMFQYAFGLQIAKRYGTELYLDLSSYQSRPKHGFALDCWMTQHRAVDDAVRQRLPRQYRSSVREHALRRFLDRFNPLLLRRVKEKPFGFHADKLNAPDNSFLVGYWQSERYFPDVREELRAQFQPKQALSSQTQCTIEAMSSEPSIAIHIRRGDYVQSRSAAAIYRSLPLASYYEPCVNAWLRKHPTGKAYVFSNDLDWCRQQLQLPCPVHFIGHVSASHAYEDMVMMSKAQALVIANSTFSWWSAWLNTRLDREIYAPRRWFHPGTLDGRNVNCADWKLVDDEAYALLPSSHRQVA